MDPPKKPVLKPYMGCLFYLLVPIVAVIGSTIWEQHEDQKEARLESARAKGMALCQKWTETYPPFVNKPGLFLYSRLNSNDETIHGRSIYISDPAELPELKPSAICAPLRDDKTQGVVRGLLVPEKYRSESWPYCHRGYRLNPDYDPAKRFSYEYIPCINDEDLILGKYWRYETGKVWKFDLEGNLLPEE